MDEGQMEALLKATVTLLCKVSGATATLVEKTDPRIAAQLRQNAQSLEQALGSLNPNPQGQP